MKPNIYWIGGAKGGVGKSIVSMALVDYLLSRKSTPLLVESDTSNPDVWKMYRETIGCQLLDLDEVDGWIGLVNACDAHPDKIVIVNTAARSNTGVAKFGTTLGESLGELDRALVAVWAINRQRDSLELLTDFMDAMPKSRVHVLRNLYFGDESKFELYAASKTLRPRVESTGGKSLSFPDLADRVADDLYKERMTIAAAVEKLPIGSRRAEETRRWRTGLGETSRVLDLGSSREMEPCARGAPRGDRRRVRRHLRRRGVPHGGARAPAVGNAGAAGRGPGPLRR